MSTEVLFVAFGAPVSVLEAVGFALALAMVIANMRVLPIAWPLAMLSSAAYAVLFQQAGLFGEAGLQLFFIAIAAWGWWQWLRGRGDDGRVLVVRRLPRRSALILATTTLLAWPLLAWLLQRFTTSTVPWWDALPTVLSVAGQWLLGRKYIETWPLWLVVNLVSMPLFAHKGLWLTVLLYGLFALLSLAGWRAWQALEGRPDARRPALPATRT
ncbi:MAG: nicotinamide riboside transporter PnuC [Rubrivivax sp.]|nr:nicotinamide riboside transporter PnuC [Rubrivivax sp.]